MKIAGLSRNGSVFVGAGADDWMREGRPLEGGGLPGIGTGRCSTPDGPKNIEEKNELDGGEEEG